jgi:hypothetical protein
MKICSSMSQSYVDAQSKKNGEPRSIGDLCHELSQLDGKVVETLLGVDDWASIQLLIESMVKEDGLGRVSLDDIRNWIAHRNYFITSKEVMIPINPKKGKDGKVPARPNVIPHKMLRDNLLKIRGLECVMWSFLTMFLVHIVARTGELKPLRRFIDEHSRFP